MDFRRANTEPSVDFRRANTELSVDFRKANTEPSVHFMRANTEYGISLGLRPREISYSPVLPCQPEENPVLPSSFT